MKDIFLSHNLQNLFPGFFDSLVRLNGEVMPRKGRELEKLVEALENYLSNKNVSIESPGFVEDRITKEKREIDVLLTSGQGHHKQLTAFECKDWVAKVGTKEVEAFQTKIKDLKINKAIIVSSSGFASTAIEKAKFYNISCLDMEEVENFDWLLTDRVYKIQKNIIKNNWQINVDNESIKKVKNSKIMHSSGNEFTSQLMTANALEYVKTIDVQDLEVGQVYRHLVNYDAKDFEIIDEDTGNKYQATECKVYLEFELKIEELPLKLVQYGDVTENNKVARAAAAEIKLNDNMAGYIMLVEQEDGIKNVVYTNQSKPNK